MPKSLSSSLPTCTPAFTQTYAFTNSNSAIPQFGSTVNYVERCKGLEERVASLEGHVKDLSTSKTCIESEAAELRGQHRMLREENEHLKQEIYAFKSSAQGAGISARLAGLEQLVREKDEALSRMNDLVQETRQAKGHLDSQIQQLRQQLASQEHVHADLSGDLTKANDVIRKLQDDLRMAKSKVRSASTLAQEQERLRKESTSQYDLLKHDLQQVRDSLEKRLREVGELEEAKRQLLSELEDLRRINEGNEKVITWLHRQIDDDRLQSIINQSFHEKDDRQPLRNEAAHEDEYGRMKNVHTAYAASDSHDVRDGLETSREQSSQEFPLAMQREAKTFFAELGIPIGPDTSLPRFTPEELADKRPLHEKESDELESKARINLGS